MGAMASRITSLTIIYSTVYSGADQRKHQSSVSLAFVRGIHRCPVNSPHKWPVMRKMLPFEVVIMYKYVEQRNHSAMTHSAENGLAPVVRYQTSGTAASRLWAKIIFHESIQFNIPLVSKKLVQIGREAHVITSVTNAFARIDLVCGHFLKTICFYWPLTNGICTIIWVRSWNCGCLVTWFCYQLIAKPGNKTATVSWPDPYTHYRFQTSNKSSLVKCNTAVTPLQPHCSLALSQCYHPLWFVTGTDPSAPQLQDYQGSANMLTGPQVIGPYDQFSGNLILDAWDLYPTLATISTGPYMFIDFLTDGSETGTGFTVSLNLRPTSMYIRTTCFSSHLSTIIVRLHLTVTVNG